MSFSPATGGLRQLRSLDRHRRGSPQVRLPGESEHARQRVLAFNVRTVKRSTGDSPEDGGKATTCHRPPAYKGGTWEGSGGLGFPATRFNDQAALSYGVEYRSYTLPWNPLEDVTWAAGPRWDWFQLVGFGELGRVAPEWKVHTLHEDMKWCLGSGARAMVNAIIVRADLGVSREDSPRSALHSHPF